MVMVRLTGGRGHFTPYEVTHIRIPVPLKDGIEAIVRDYKDYIIDGGDPDSYVVPPPPPRGSQFAPNDIYEVAKRVLRSRKGGRESVVKLLTGYLGGKFDPDRLS